MKRRLRFVFALTALAATWAGRTATGADSPRIGDERVLLRTTRGDLVLAFYPDVAPKHTAQFLKLVRMGAYDSTWIHRVEPNYLVQLSNVQNRKRSPSPEQLAAITKLPAEFSSVPHRAGTLSMARDPADPNSAETSFSFMLNAAPHLDGKYTVFGAVEFGMPLLSMLANEPRDQRGAPVDSPVVEQAIVVTAQDIAARRQGQQLREPVAAAAATPRGSHAWSPLATTAVVLILLCNLAGFLLTSRWRPRTRAALNALAALIAALLLIAEYAPAAARSSLMVVSLLAGVFAFYRLSSRFERSPRA